MLMIVSVSDKHMQKRIIVHPRLKKVRYVLLGIGIILLACGYGLWQKMRHNTPLSGSTSSVARQPDTDAAVDTKVRTLIAQHDTDGMLAYYDAQASLLKTDPSRLQMLRMNQSLRAADVKRYDAALTAAKQADKIKSTSATLAQIAHVYELQNDKKNAIAFYTKARDMVPVVKAGRFNPTQQYDAAIARLSQ